MNLPSPVSINNYSMTSNDPVHSLNMPQHTSSNQDPRIQQPCSTTALLNSTKSQLRSHFSKCPTLEEILSGRAPHPYNYANFVGYLSQNHCLETVEFTNDVAKYTEKYESGLASKHELNQMWRRIVDAYIRPDGPKELNLPCGVKKGLSSLSDSRHSSTSSGVSNMSMSSHDDEPPSPQRLQSAVEMAKDMMKENAYLPFIASVRCAQHESSHNTNSNISGISENESQSHSNMFDSSCSMFHNTFSSIASQLPSPAPPCSWQQPSSWCMNNNNTPLQLTDSNSLSKSSSSDSLYAGGSEEVHFNRGPMTPPDSPHGFTSPCSNYSSIRSRSYSSTECSSIPLSNSSSNSTDGVSFGSSTFPQYVDQAHCAQINTMSNHYNPSQQPQQHVRSHWRKMSKRLKWGRRNSDKDGKILPPTSSGNISS